jgi:hypothetical protein
MAVDKSRYCIDGDVLVDDQLRNQRPWENAGGVFIHHKSAEETHKVLTRYFPGVQHGDAIRKDVVSRKQYSTTSSV